jgi:hypothetical protein
MTRRGGAPAIGLLMVGIGVGACTFDSGGPGPEGTGDDPPDGASPTTECWDYQPTNLPDCPFVPGGGLDLDDGPYELDLEAGTLTSPGSAAVPVDLIDLPGSAGPSIKVLSITSLSVGAGATLVVRGDSPLLVLVHGSAQIDGAIDVSAEGTEDGPGGGFESACGNGGTGLPAIAVPEAGAGGGAGGAYGGDGGEGGDGRDQDDSGAEATAASGAPAIEPLHGGCRGGSGGDGHTPLVDGIGGAGGGGGGALQISARDELALGATAEIRSNGGGGQAGQRGTGASRSGGGGGGSGGAILLEGSAIGLAAGAKLCANGGSGGEGAHGVDDLGEGQDGTCSEDRVATQNQAGNGGDGGRGGARSPVDGEGGGDGGGAMKGAGGGGGGAAGRIRLRAQQTISLEGGNMVLSPEPFIDDPSIGPPE